MEKTWRQYKPGKPESCLLGSQCDYCHYEHRKHRSQRGRHNLQKKEYQEQKGNLPQEFTEHVDKMYKMTFDAFVHIKKLLATLKEEPDSLSAMEKAVLCEVNEIGKCAQNKRPDNARLRRTSEPQASHQVDLQGRCKWLSGTLHLMIRKMFDDEKVQSQEEKLKTIGDSLDECLNMLERVTEQLTMWSDQDQERISKAFIRTEKLHASLAPKVHAFMFQERLRSKKDPDYDFQEELLKELCLDWSRLKAFEETTLQKMKDAASLKDFAHIVQQELQTQLDSTLGPQGKADIDEWGSTRESPLFLKSSVVASRTPG